MSGNLVTLRSLLCLETDVASLGSATTVTTACHSPSPAPSPMDLIQDHLRLLMEGRPYEELHEFCDYSLQEQNEVSSWHLASMAA